MLRRIRPILFVLLTLAVVGTLRQVMPADRSHLILIAANLVAAWVIVSITSRFIRNRLVARIVAGGAWSVAAFKTLSISAVSVELNFPSTYPVISRAPVWRRCAARRLPIS